MDASPFRWQTAPRRIVALAPMAGVTDASYRRFLKKLCPSAVLYSEFLSTDAITYGAKKTLRMMEFDPALERPFIVQIFGKKPEHFLEAAKVVEQMGADGIDINMGCPAARVVSSCHGSALIKNPALACELVASVKKVVRIPVSVKTRLGWDTSETLIPFCRGLIDAGADALAIHGRRFVDKYKGDADWEPIYALKRIFPATPIIGNGDIKTAADAVTKLGNLDGVMVGRGTFGNPWLLADIANAFQQYAVSSMQNAGPSISPTVERLSLAEKIPFILEHCCTAVEVKGEERGMREMRRHLAFYVKGFPGAAELRARLVRVEHMADVENILRSVA